jgi:proteasome lid subunit RPN8/RPN11
MSVLEQFPIAQAVANTAKRGERISPPRISPPRLSPPRIGSERFSEVPARVASERVSEVPPIASERISEELNCEGENDQVVLSERVTGDRVTAWRKSSESVSLNTLPKRNTGALSGRRSTGLDIIIRRTALSCIRAYGDSNPNAQTYGILVGDLYQDASGPYLLIEQIIQAESAGGSDFTDTWEKIQELMNENYPNSRIVGWYRTCPGNGVFLSNNDRTLHDSYFGIPWQAALIYNPQLREVGIFSTRAGALVGIELLVEGDQAASAQPKPAKRSGARTFGRFLLALIALALFAAMGFLLGMLLLQVHFHLPPQQFPS